MSYLPVIDRIGVALLLCTILSVTGCSCRQDRVPPKESVPSVEKSKSQEQKTDKEPQEKVHKSQPKPWQDESDTPSEAQTDSQKESPVADHPNATTDENSKPGGALDSGGQSEGTEVPFTVPGSRTLFGNKNKAESAPLTREEINDRMSQAEKNLERAKKCNGNKDYQTAYGHAMECWTQLKSLESNKVNGLETLRQDCLVQMKIASGQLNKKAASNSYDRTNIIEYK